MHRKDFGQLVASAMIAVAGASVGVALMAVLGKKIDAKKVKEKKGNNK